MNTSTQPLHQHHKHCDELFAIAEDKAHAADWPACESATGKFIGEMEAHFATEEEVVFRAFEENSGMVGGPSQVMRTEHRQMRDLMAQMTDALSRRDRNTFAGVAETLLILMQQHNMKEENILYPMCDGPLVAAGIDVVGALHERVASAVQTA